MHYIFGTGLHLVHSSLHTVCCRVVLCLHHTLYILSRFAFCSFTVCTKFALGLHHTWICSCLDIVAECPVYCGSTVVSGGKVKRIDQFLLSPKLFGLVDVFMHKAQFWSFDNYMKRVSEDARLSFLDHVERTHKENRDDHEGTSALHARGILFESDAAIICLTCVCLLYTSPSPRDS